MKKPVEFTPEPPDYSEEQYDFRQHNTFVSTESTESEQHKGLWKTFVLADGFLFKFYSLRPVEKGEVILLKDLMIVDNIAYIQ